MKFKIIHFILFQKYVELKLIIKLNCMFKFGSFSYQSSSSLFTSCLIIIYIYIERERERERVNTTNKKNLTIQKSILKI